MKSIFGKHFSGFTLLILAVCLVLSGTVSAQKKKKYVVNAYVGGFRGLANVEEIDAGKLTHINYAFVNVQDSMAVLTNLATDSTNFRKLNALKKINPDLKIVISIGGWAWSENFSDAVLTESSRLKFAKSSVDIVRQFDLDGVDIDWEYPGMRGEEGNVFRPEDKQNFTLMFKALRDELNLLEKEKGKKYLLTTAVGGSKSFIEHTEMGLAQAYLDYVLIMTYDYGGRNGTVGHHTNLYDYDRFRRRFIGRSLGERISSPRACLRARSGWGRLFMVKAGRPKRPKTTAWVQSVLNRCREAVIPN
jgi:chitinase